MSGLRDRLAQERGVAMVVAMGILAVLMALGAAVLTSANNLGASTRTETARKKAFEAAQAGLEATIYRLNMLSPDDALCTGGSATGGDPYAVLSPGGQLGPWCRPFTQSLGNGASYTAWTSAVLSTSNQGACGGLQVGTATSVLERCVVSRGTIDGVARRVQARIGSYAAARVFPAAGLVGTRSVQISNQGEISGVIGSNGPVSLGSGAWARGIQLGPAAPAPVNPGQAPVTRRTTTEGPFTLAPVDPGDTATNADGNQRLSNAQQGIAPADIIGSGVVWNPTTRSLTLANNASVTLGGAKYNFCTLSLGNGATVRLAVGVRTAIYVDSPERPGSGCPPTSGTFSMSNGARIENTAPPASGSAYPDPTALQVYVYGKTASDVVVANTGNFYGTLYAPRSKVVLRPSNNSTITGAVAAQDVVIGNVGAFYGDEGAARIKAANAAQQFFETSWRECRPDPVNAGNPGSGC